MEAQFWVQKWKNDEIPFHEKETNSLLVKYFEVLALVKGDRIFVPLCGKTLDIAWLLSNGYRVAGAELSEIAIKQLFADLGVEPKISKIGELKHYSAENLDIFVGDIFTVSRTILGQVDGVYDRAALVALPVGMRKQYTTHITKLTDNAPQLLICFEYDQSMMDGPPFSISNNEIKQHYSNRYNLSLLEELDVPGGLKGKCAAREKIWFLQRD